MAETALFDSISYPEDFTASKLYDVSGQVAVVSGGGTGLGLVTAAALAANGVKVYIVGRRLDRLESAESIIKLVAEVSKEEKWINILVNNHGSVRRCPDINICEQTAEGLSKLVCDSADFETWEDTHRSNVTSQHFLTFAFLPLLAAANSVGGHATPGNVVMIASISGLSKTSQGGRFSYNSSKAAVIALSRMLSTEFARRNLGIRVNCICPGSFPTSMSSDRTSDTKSVDEIVRKQRELAGRGIPLGRLSNARDYAQVMLMLVSNAYMTGSEMVIDGGFLLEE